MKRINFLKQIFTGAAVAIAAPSVLAAKTNEERIDPLTFFHNKGWTIEKDEVNADQRAITIKHPGTEKRIRILFPLGKERESVWVFADPEEFSHFSAFYMENNTVLTRFMNALYEVYKIGLF